MNKRVWDKTRDTCGTNCKNVHHLNIMCTPIIRKVQANDFDTYIDMCTYNEVYLIRLFNKVIYTWYSILFKIEESKQQLTDDCGVYISTPEEIELYNKHLKACEALNEMYNGYGSPFWYQHFEFENGKFIPNPLLQYHAVLFKINVTNSIKNN